MSEYTENEFLPRDKEEAENELSSYNYSLINALKCIADGELEKAAGYHENASRSLRELQRMLNEKETVREALLQIEQLRGNRQMEEMLNRLKVSSQ